jgi:hypothetical protein
VAYRVGEREKNLRALAGGKGASPAPYCGNMPLGGNDTGLAAAATHRANGRPCFWLRYVEPRLLFAPPNHADAHQPCREQSDWGRNRNRSDSERCWLTNTAIDQSGLTSGSAEDVEGEESRNIAIG